MKDPKSILYKKDYVLSYNTDIKKTFAKFKKEQKKASTVQVAEKSQPYNIVQYKKFK